MTVQTDEVINALEWIAAAETELRQAINNLFDTAIDKTVPAHQRRHAEEIARIAELYGFDEPELAILEIKNL